MEDQQEKPFTAEQLDAFSEEKCNGGVCPMCGSKEWWAEVGEPSQRLEYLVANRKGTGLPGHLNTVAVIWFVCANCGFVRQHLERVIRGWVNERP